jgi:hypothetical protein
MTTRFKDFGGSKNESKEPVRFKLYNEEFFCKPAVQGKVLLELVSKTSEDNPAEMANIITEFFSKVLLPESAEKFNNLLEDEEKIVSVETLGEISSWLMEQYSNRPLVVPEPSSTGQ